MRCSDDLPCPLRSLRNRLVKSHIKAATSKYLQSSPGGITTKSLLGPGKHVATCVKALKPGSLCLSRRIKLAQRVAETASKVKGEIFAGLRRGIIYFSSLSFRLLFVQGKLILFVGLLSVGVDRIILHSIVNRDRGMRSTQGRYGVRHSSC